MRARGICVSLGADGAACNNRLDMFDEMRLAATLQAVRHGPGALTARDALWMATREGARALGLDERNRVDRARQARRPHPRRPRAGRTLHPTGSLVDPGLCGARDRRPADDGRRRGVSWSDFALTRRGRGRSSAAEARISGGRSWRPTGRRWSGDRTGHARLSSTARLCCPYNLLAVDRRRVLTTMMRHPELPERDRRILGAVVQAYIDQGEPVSSLWLANRGFGVSSATLRNVHGAARGAGLRAAAAHLGGPRADRSRLSQLRRSAAGRAATRAPRRMSKRGSAAPGRVEDLLSHVSQEVSRASHQVGSRCARGDTTTLEHLDFVPLDGGKVLVVVVATGGHISHKVIEPSEEFEHGELQQAANYLNSEFKGQSLLEVRQAVLDRLREERTLYDVLMARALRLASSTFEDLDRRRRSSSRARRCCSKTSAAEDPEVDARDAADAAADDRREDAAGAAARRLHRRRRPDDRHRLGASASPTCSASAWSSRRYSDGTARAPSASSARRACATRARSTPSTACPGPSTGWSAAEILTRPVGPVSSASQRRHTMDDNDTTRLPRRRPDEHRAARRRRRTDPPTLQQQRDDYYDRLLRKTAEFDNYRKRIERERQELAERRRPTLVRSCCRSSTTSSARSRPTPAPRAPRPIAAASS